jgi:hypothetical protein
MDPLIRSTLLYMMFAAVALAAAWAVSKFDRR